MDGDGVWGIDCVWRAESVGGVADWGDEFRDVLASADVWGVSGEGDAGVGIVWGVCGGCAADGAVDGGMAVRRHGRGGGVDWGVGHLFQPTAGGREV